MPQGILLRYGCCIVYVSCRCVFINDFSGLLIFIRPFSDPRIFSDYLKGRKLRVYKFSRKQNFANVVVFENFVRTNFRKFCKFFSRKFCSRKFVHAKFSTFKVLQFIHSEVLNMDPETSHVLNSVEKNWLWGWGDNITGSLPMQCWVTLRAPLPSDRFYSVLSHCVLFFWFKVQVVSMIISRLHIQF